MSILLAAALAQAAGTITFEIGNVRSGRGKVIVAVCTQAKFLKETCAFHGETQARPGTVAVTVRGVPAGTYAAQAFHDENGNEEVDRNFIGIPKEGVGFSRDARINFGPPKWRDAQFAHNGQPASQRLRMRYMVGQSGPARGR